MFRRLLKPVTANSCPGEPFEHAEKDKSGREQYRKDAWKAIATDIARLGTLIGLDLYHTVALVLKREWEQRHEHESGGFHTGNMIHLLPSKASGLNRKFKADIDTLLKVLQQGPSRTGAEGLSQDSLSVMVHEMIAANLHLLANDSPEMKAFAKHAAKAASLLGDATPLNEETFLIAKTDWLQLHDELGNCLILLERRRLENAEIKRSWLTIFGKEFLALQEQAKRMEGLKLRLSLLDSDPSLTLNQIEQLVLDNERERAASLQELELDIILAFTARKIPMGKSITREHYIEFKQNYKQVLRRIWLMIHPDRLQNHQMIDPQ